jgi:cytochrome P450
LVASAVRQPRVDLMSSLAEANSAALLSADELFWLVFQIYNASYQTVVGLLGNGMTLLLKHPSEYARLKADPSLVGRAVAEMLRYDPPVQTTGRHAAVNATVGGARITPAELVITVLAAANRDPDRYRDPGHFDVGRDGPPSVAFGFGVHYCLGAPLAMLQAEAAFRALSRRSLSIEPTGPPRLHPSVNMRSRSSVPVRVRHRSEVRS